MTPPDTRARTVVVAAASRHGSTLEIAQRIEASLREHLSDRWIVTQADLLDPQTLDGADAIVLGSAVYLGHWMRPAIKALHRVRDAPLLDLWLFSTGPVSDDSAENDGIITADEMVDAGYATEHMVFAGRIDVERLSRWEQIVVRAVGVVSGDHRDWTAVDAWGAHIAGQLEATVTAVPTTAVPDVGPDA